MSLTKTLVIDSHKGTFKPSSNLHWKNAQRIAAITGGDLIWSYPDVNTCIKGGYERIIFVHASPYAYTDYAWVEESPDAELYYVTNEYNLGEPRTLWMAAKQGRHYTVIANHPPEPSKIVMKYVKGWYQVNLNALCYEDRGFSHGRGMCYYGSFRKDRIPYFQKWLNGDVVVSTHSKNRPKFEAVGVTGPFVDRLKIDDGGLCSYGSSLYIEDTTTHTHYNYLANRFYEAVSWGVTPVFDPSCINTICQSGLPNATVSNVPIDAPFDPALKAFASVDKQRAEHELRQLWA